MPNWCENELQISGYESPEQLKSFLDLALKNPISEKNSDSGDKK